MKSSAKEELQRAEALEQYEAILGAPDPAMAEVTALAAEICATPMAGISLVGPDAIYFQARFGPGPARAPRGRMPCEMAIHSDGVYEITDARYHKDFRPDGIMISGRAFRFYAGAPLTTAAGVTIGALFVQDSVPHTLTDKQKKALLTLAAQIINRYELNTRVRVMEREGRVRHRVESALTVERNFVATVLDTVGALVAVFDTAGRIVRFNRTCEEVSGYDFATLQGSYLWDKLIPPADVPAAIADFERLRNGKFPASFENYWCHRGGSLRRIAWSATALVEQGQAGGPTGGQLSGQTNFLILTGIDVTQQRAAESTLRESEARYRQLVEGSLGMVCTHDTGGVLLSVNTHGAESLGRGVDDMVGQPLAAFMPDEHRGAVGPYLREIVETGEAQGRLHICHRDGDIRVIAFRNKLIEISGREPYVLGFGVDISEQVRAEEKLRALIHQSNSILESVGDGIYGVDLDGRVTVVNPAAAQMLAYKPNELLGRNLHELVMHTRADGTPYPESESHILAAIKNLDTVRAANEVFWRKDGTSFPVEYVARPQIDSSSDSSGERGSGKAIGVVVAFTDTTERRALDRMKDEFISTVSHELRTPLTSLRAALGLVTGGALATRPEKMQQMLEIAIGNTDRLIRLVNDILDIERISSGNAQLHSAICPAAALLDRAVSLQQAAALKNNLHFTIDAADVEVWADPDRILQTLVNLISNAAKFSPPGGKITLVARNLDKNEAQFDISDQGRGVPADKLESIFERFQQVDASDSRDRGGTGLGLAICRSIITQHGGKIWATSPPGRGATFHFTLPRHPSQYLR
jgi:two-component system sensor histidine kinase VicK